eukprot:GHVU01197362.1.p1 GENE.GHVU01197362.1~~GHVU01197362.1.p1  ORF type:complete len:120 (+),score=19.59 GHVU01197362.1:431-790(+)
MTKNTKRKARGDPTEVLARRLYGWELPFAEEGGLDLTAPFSSSSTKRGRSTSASASCPPSLLGRASRLCSREDLQEYIGDRMSDATAALARDVVAKLSKFQVSPSVAPTDRLIDDRLID